MNADVQVFREVRHLVFGVGQVQKLPEGGRAVVFVENGEAHIWPLDRDAAAQLARDLRGVETAPASALTNGKKLL